MYVDNIEKVRQKNGEQKKVAIIGSGITGLSTAWGLSKNGYSTVILEKQNFPGGLAGSIPHNGYQMDLGPHFLRLSRNSPIAKDIEELIGKANLKEVQFSYKVYFWGHILNTAYPDLYDVVFKFGTIFFLKSLFSFLSSRLIGFFKKDLSNAEDYLIQSYGDFLYKIWFRPYFSERYGDPKEQPKDIAVSLFPYPSFPNMLSYIIKKSFSKKTTESKTTNKSDDENVNWYFPYGMGFFIKKIIKYIESKGGELQLGVDIESIDHSSKIITFVKNKIKKKLKVDIIIYSTPLPISIKWFDNAPKDIQLLNEKGTRLNSIMVFLGIDVSRLFDGWIINVYDPKISFFRISQQSYLSDKVAPNGKTLLCLEIKISDNDPLWNSDDLKILTRVEKDLKKIGILSTEKIDDHKIIRMKGTYPVVGKITNDNSSIMKYINSHPNEHTLGTASLDPGRLVGSRLKNSSDLKPISGGLYGALTSTRIIVQKIINETKN